MAEDEAESQFLSTSVESPGATPAAAAEPVPAEKDGDEAKEKDASEEKEGAAGDKQSKATESSAPAAAAAASSATTAVAGAVDPTKVGGRYNRESGETLFVGSVLGLRCAGCRRDIVFYLERAGAYLSFTVYLTFLSQNIAATIR